ncbi:MAG: ATP-binding protein [Muribaculaceae bacterium]|nr:ATP-binding protein [Muribaculaceae bacterium]
MKRLQRKEYLDKLLALRKKQIIKVITGVRRCGKSTLLEIMQDELRSMGVQEKQIIAINFEDYENKELRNPDILYSHIVSRLSNSGTTYIFLDEIQHVNNFADVVNAIFIKPNVDLYITGSNAFMLSSEIATLLSGRYLEINLLPLSYSEYIESSGNENDLNRKYINYITNSSFPYTTEIQDNPTIVNDYLQGIYNTIILKDVMQRRSFRDVMMLESIVAFVMDNIGNTLSSKKIADTMTSSGRKIDVKTVEKYLSALQESFIIYKAGRYNIKGRQLLKTMKKYYLVDVALRQVILGRQGVDLGHLLENIVYLELLRRNQHVFIGKSDNLEIDFVTINGQDISYYQVAATVRDENTLRRELTPLQNIRDNHPKWLLTLDDDPDINLQGIRKVNVLQWLLHKNKPT